MGSKCVSQKKKRNKEKLICFFESLIKTCECEEKWPSDHLSVSSLVLALSNSTLIFIALQDFWRTLLVAFQAQQCMTLPSGEYGKKIIICSKRNMGTSAVKDFSSHVHLWHRSTLLRALLINMVLWIAAGLHNSLCRSFQHFQRFCWSRLWYAFQIVYVMWLP